jgi:hypothetical protein
MNKLKLLKKILELSGTLPVLKNLLLSKNPMARVFTFLVKACARSMKKDQTPVEIIRKLALNQITVPTLKKIK